MNLTIAAPDTSLVEADTTMRTMTRTYFLKIPCRVDDMGRKKNRGRTGGRDGEENRKEFVC